MKYSDTLVAIGGLMRCCTTTIADEVSLRADEEIDFDIPLANQSTIAEVLDCKYESPGNEQIILEVESDGRGSFKGTWRWNHV